MKEIPKLREEYNKMGEPELVRENLLCQIRMARALEKIAHSLEKIDNSVGNLKLY